MNIRDRDAVISQQTDARGEAILQGSAGNRVRTQQYIYRPTADADEIRMTSIALSEASGLSYIDLRVAFQTGEFTGQTALQIRSLPWNEYLHYVVNDGGTLLHYPVRFGVVGDGGLQTNTCGSTGSVDCSTLAFDNIWSAFRVNHPRGPDRCPRSTSVRTSSRSPSKKSFVNASSQTVQVLSSPVQTFLIPWPRMIWNGESDF